MKRFQIEVLLILLLVIPAFGYVADTVEYVADPCDGYWELSYKHSYLTLADSLWHQDEISGATGLYEIAAEKFRKENNWKGLVKAMNRVSENFRMSFQFDTVIAILDGNLDIIAEHLNNDPAELAEVYYIIGKCYDWQREVQKSLQAHNQALEIRRDLFGENHFDIARGYRAIGEMFRYDDQSMNAEKYLAKAAYILVNLGCENSLEAGNTYYSLASTYRGLGDYDKASIYCIKALSVFENIYINTFDNRTNCYSLIANINFNKRNYEESNYYNSIAINMLLEQKNLTRPQQRNLANYMNTVASTYTKKKSYDSAFIYLSKSLNIYKKMEGNDDNVSLIYQNTGINHTDLGQFDSAYSYLSKAIEIRKQIFGEKHFKTSSSFRFMGKLFEKMGELDQALNYYQQAIVAGSGKKFNNYHPDTNPDHESLTYDGSLLEALWKKGAVLKKIYLKEKNRRKSELSLETLLIAIENMDGNQELYQLEGSTLLMTRDYYGVFEDALDVSYILYELTNNKKYLETAFFAMEKSKARLLFDSFSKLQKNQMVGIPDSLVAVEHSIKSRLASLTRDLENEQKKDSVNNTKIKELEEKIFQRTVRLEIFFESMEATYPSYANAVKSELLDLTTVQNSVTKEGSILVDYFWGDSALFSLVIQEGEVRFIRQPIDPVKLLVSKYQAHLLEGPQFTDRSARFKEFSENAFALYQLLFKEVGQPKEKSLIIAPDGLLRFIPFEALVVKEPEKGITDYDKLRYVVHYYPTSYVYSANLWAMEPKSEPRKLRVLGFSHSGLDNEMPTKQTNELPGTALEIEVLKNQMKGLCFSGLEATKQHFIDHAQDYDIIHLAIHGISDSISHLNNRLLFRNPADEHSSEPLYEYELYNFRLNSKLAVLSACESGIGKNFQGEGVYSMSRAFSYAGCPTTVMSLWRISDKTTPKILEQFYHQISRGKDIDYALRTAKLNYLKENPGSLAHPSYWAAMVVHGATDRLISRSYTSLLIPLFALVILAFVMVKMKKTHRWFQDTC